MRQTSGNDDHKDDGEQPANWLSQSLVTYREKYETCGDKPIDDDVHGLHCNPAQHCMRNWMVVP